MAVPRRRQQSTLSSWPTLSLFAVYSAVPLLAAQHQQEKQSDAALEAAKILFLTGAQGEDELTVERQARLMGTVMGVAGFTRTFGGQDRPADELVVHSSKRRMVWLEAEPGFFIHLTIALPRSSRHSRRASAATTSSAASSGADPPPGGLNNDVLLAALRQGYRKYRLRRGSMTGMLEKEGREVLAKTVEGYWRKWAEDWEVGSAGGVSSLERLLDTVPRCSLLGPHISSQLLPLLAQFAANNPSTLPVLLHSSTILSLPVLPAPSATSFETDPDAPPTRAKKPPPPPLTEDDLLALVRLVAVLSPAQHTLSVQPDLPDTPFPPSHPLANSSLSASSPRPVDEGSLKWMSSFADGVSSLLAPRPLSSVSMPGLPSFGSSASSLATVAEEKKPPNLRAGFKALRKQEQDMREQAEAEEQERKRKRETSSESGSGTGWTLRGLGWGKLGFGSDSAVEGVASTGGAGAETAAKAPPETASSETEATAEPVGTIDEAAPPPSSAAEAAPPTTHEQQQPSEPTTPIVELAPTVNEGELAEALGASPVPSPSRLATPPPPVEIKEVKPLVEEDREDEKPEEEELEKDQTLELFCGVDGQETKFCLRKYERGVLSLALAYLPLPTDEEMESFTSLLDTRAERLLEAVESVLEVIVPPEPTYPHRHFVKHGTMVSAFSPTPSTATATADEAEASLALLESFRMLKSAPLILESLTRLSSSSWVVHRRALDSTSPFSSSHSFTSTATSHPTDVYAVLPAKTSRGKDASLLEAAEELRRVARAYYT
ncbi:hypothetical protein JCM8547_006784 [Rhodosporidiobolus lusitaniae]